MTNRPTKTNSWFSSFYSFPSHNVFAYPGIFKIDEKGVHVGVPHVSAVEKTQYGNFVPECIVSFDGNVMNSSVYSYSDWGVTMEVSGNKFKTMVTLIQGSPYVHITSNSAVNFTCGDGFKSRYAFQAFENNTYRLTILPLEKEFDQTILTNKAWNPIIDTQVSHATDRSQIKTTLQFLTKLTDTTAIALLPHQVHNTKEKFTVLGHYETAIGQMSLIMGKKVELFTSNPALPFTFKQVLDKEQRQIIKNAVVDDVAKILKENTPDGVYFRGTYVGALATVAQLSDVYGLTSERDLVLDKLERVLRDQLSKNIYNRDKTMLIASNPEFGHELGSDHHFHWGYYIRAAAVLAAMRPVTLSEFSPKVEMMVSDIASFDRTSKTYPYLRVFSPYESHSWADGRALFADGNNQESTSEALNAWYAIAQWGEVSHNANYKDLGSWLFAEELIGTKTYWFADNNPFAAGYAHPIASIVWGGKRDFATWFSGQTMHIYGIQFLPITPASVYLKSLPSPDKYIQDINSNKVGAATHEWGDLFVAFLSFTYPYDAVNELPQVNSTVGLKLKSLLFQTVYSNFEEAHK